MQLQPQVKLATPTHSRNAPGLLLVFVALSFLAHSSAFLFYGEQPPLIPTQNIGAAFIVTVLASEDNHTTISSNQKTEATALSNNKSKTINTTTKNIKRILKKNPDTNSKTIHKPNIALTQPRKETLQHPVVEEVSTETLKKNNALLNATKYRQQQRNYLLGELQNRLSQYLVYPLRARRRGWQGEVMVAVHINEDGQLGSVHLSRSSGYSLLDHSALTAISQLEPINLPIKFGPPQAMNLQLPVHYRLQES